jgi:hypothetical protein
VQPGRAHAARAASQIIAAGINLFGGPLGLLHRHVTGAIPIRRNTRDPGYLIILKAYVAELLKDHDSRRALVLINRANDQIYAVDHGSKDVPCTLSLQFFVRDNKLHLHAHMRSNDVFWGLTYDLFSFTMLQEVMMLELRDSRIFMTLSSTTTLDMQ